MAQNCYAFACGYSLNEPLDPGVLGGRKYDSTQAQDMIAAAYIDGLDYEANVIPMLNAGEHLVALFVSSTMDIAYHWLRRLEDGSGNWEHKPGAAGIRTEDARDVRLNDVTNPVHAADLNYEAAYAADPKKRALLPMARAQGWAVPYDIFVGYFRCPDDFPQVRAPARIGSPCCECVIL